jgi:hypothetical protein
MNFRFSEQCEELLFSGLMPFCVVQMHRSTWHYIPEDNFVYASKEVGLEINVEKTKYMLLSCHQNAAKNWDIKIANRSFENVSEFK